MKKIKLVMIGLVVSLLTVGSVYAQEQSVGKPDGGGRLKESIYKELNLTPEQQAKLEANRAAQRAKISQLRTAMMEKEKQMQQSLKELGVTRATVEPLVNEIKSLQAQLIDLRISGIFAVKEILSPEQISKLNQVMEKRREDKKGHSQDWHKEHKGMEADQGR